MPPDTQRSAGGSGERRHHKDKVGNYDIGPEIGRGSFATVYKGTRLKSHQPLAIKAVSRQKLTAKLQENLESEINILKVISHRNIVSLDECFKSDTHIYLVMEFCSGADLSVYIKNRGKTPTLDFHPRLPSSINGEKVFWQHPPSGGLDEKVTRCFLGQLAAALMFLRSQNLMHRDIKPQNLLMQPASIAELDDGHPLGIPILKVADFGFARILPAAAMAETLCGSPLYMAPEILRYEKYDATADLWSVGAVLFEMAVGRPPFRANNHVELLRKIEKGEDRIKFPDESSRAGDEEIPAVPVSPDIKALIRGLLKRHPLNRMGFDEFFNCGVWDAYMTASSSTEGEGSLSLDVSTDAESSAYSGKVRDMVESAEKQQERLVPTNAPQPLSTERAMNPQPAPQPVTHGASPAPKSNQPEPKLFQPVPKSIQGASTVNSPTSKTLQTTPRIGNPSLQIVQATPKPIEPVPEPIEPESSLIRAISPPPFARPIRRSEPKYYVSDNAPASPEPTSQTYAAPTVPIAPAIISSGAGPRPIQTAAHRRVSSRDKEPSSIEEPQPITPNFNALPPPRSSRVSEGSPLAATPPITMVREESPTGKHESALDASDSAIGREYVVVEKQTVEINALADEFDQATRRPTALIRKPSSRTSIVTRPVSSFKPTYSAPTSAQQQALVAQSYSPPFAFSTTPPFSVSNPYQSSPPVLRTPSIPKQMNVNTFPPTTIPYSEQGRYGSSPTTQQATALARALTNTAMRLLNTSADKAVDVINRVAAARQQPIIQRTGYIDPIQDVVLGSAEDLARKAFVLFELADSRLIFWQSLSRTPGLGTPPLGQPAPRRKSSSSSFSSEVVMLRQQEQAAGEAVGLYCRALGFIAQATARIQGFWQQRGGESEASSELNEMVQWLRARFNECYEKAEWAKKRCADELPFIDKLVHDKAKETSRHAALAELQCDYPTAEAAYETSLWLLQAMLEDPTTDVRAEDRSGLEKLIIPIRMRLDALKRKTETYGNTS